jgi:hypothetical protein
MANNGTGIRIRTKKSTGAWLEKVRSVTGKTKADFARFIGTTPQNYQFLINGVHYPGFKVIATLKFHGYDVDKLLSV